jgi:flagellar M-ring protein FliF
VSALIQTLRSLGGLRLMARGAVGIAGVAFFIYLSTQLSAPGMALLYADLNTKDSAQIVAKLETANVPFTLKAGGTQIYVPADKALRLRMTLAQEGLPRDGSVGYEIFDRSEGVGSSSLVQNVNRLRALEGELSRTIRSMAQVSAARVHVVLPKRQLFAREREQPSASIILKTYRGEPLSAGQVVAIQHLVAAAVPGLKPDRISIVDDRGNLLARGTKGGDTVRTAARSADEQRRVYESRLAHKIETILGRSLGPGKVRAQVTADMDFDRITTAVEKYDPDGRVVRSTQTDEEKTTAQNKQAQKPVTAANNLRRTGQQANENETGSSISTTKTRERINYEISKTVRNHVRVTGDVKRVSVAVLVDGTYTVADGKATYQPRTKEDLERITALVRSAIGFDAKRGDVVQVTNMQFAEGAPKPDAKSDEPFLGLYKADYMRIAEVAVLAILSLLVLLMVVRPIVRRLIEPAPAEPTTPRLADQSGDTAALPSPDGEGGEGALDADAMIDLGKIEGRVKASTVKKVGDIVEKHPEETVQIVRNWMYQET